MKRTLYGAAMRAACIAAMMWTGLAAQAGSFPDKPVTVVVPQAPGGANDAVARLYAKELGDRLGQSFVVDNRPGAGGNIGTATVARAVPDGYTLLMTVNSTQAINPLLYRNAGFDPLQNFVPIGGAGTVPNVLLVHPESKATTLAALVAQAKARPGQVRYGSAGNGTLPHLLGAMLASQTGSQLEHVPYKGIAPALTDLLGGRVQMVFATLPAALPHIRSGALRALAVTSPERAPALPDVPAVGETLPGYQGILWIALYAPHGTPPDALGRLREAFAAVREMPALRQHLAEMGVAPMADDAQALDERLRTEIGLWSDVIRKSKVEVN